MQQLKDYVAKWLQFQSLWDLEAEYVFNRLGESLAHWQQLLTKIKKARSTFDTSEAQKSFGVYVIDYEQVQARGVVEDVRVGGERGGWTVGMPRPAPVLEGVDSSTRWAGPDLGVHNEEILCGELGLRREDVDGLARRGVVGGWVTEKVHEAEEEESYASK